MNDTLIIILVLVLLVVGVFMLVRWRVRRAVSQVIQIFKEHNAVSIKNAKTADELGFSEQTMTKKMIARRDYKLEALKALMRVDIIQMTEDGRLYLSEDKLRGSKLYKP